MTRWFGPALLAVTLTFGGSTGINPAAAAQSQAAVQKSQAGQATDFSARRYYHRHYYHYGYRRYYRPYYPITRGRITIGLIRTTARRITRRRHCVFGFGGHGGGLMKGGTC